jgi:hypothetical protein
MVTDSSTVTDRQMLISCPLLLGLWRAKAGALIVAVAQFLAGGSHAEDCAEVTLQFLRKHDVPCSALQAIDRSRLDYVVTCNDGRSWALFWLENEVAYVEPQTGTIYRWQPELAASYPNLYGGLRVNENNVVRQVSVDR